MILHMDFSTGASGDKILGGLIEVCEARGISGFAEVQRVGAALVPGIAVSREQVQRSGVTATHIEVTENAAPHRHWTQIRSLIQNAGDEGVITAAACALALKAFEAVARAEGAVHGLPMEQVHFHEVGAADSIVDIVCTSQLLSLLGATAIYATPLALGNGTVLCAHGELPVPAPATARLIEGLPVYAGVYDGELTTPTGAALAATCVTAFQPLPLSTPVACGYGAGSRELPGAANVVRVLAAEPWVDSDTSEDTGVGVEGCALLCSNIDHLSPEALAFACEELMAGAALDVWQQPITMKKGRLAVQLCVLGRASDANMLASEIMRLTGTLGVRREYVERTVLPREVLELQTPYGPVPFKAANAGTPANRRAWLRPEHDAVATIARNQGLDYNSLYAELTSLDQTQVS